jgi:diacylglycerol O-acyltransferase/trehalose O-mycolyltransferase
MAARRVWLLLLLLVLTGCGGGAQPASTPPPTGPATSPTPPASSAPAAATIVATKQISERQVDLTVASPAVGGEVMVRLLLPQGFKRQPTKPRPVLYLLHGCCDTYVSWTRSTDLEKLTKDSDLLVVMPDGGKVGFYSDWKSGPAWERFHLTELPALLKQEYGAGEPRAIAGVSMGGLGALGYAARHPGMFRAVASFSGIVHTRITPDTAQGYIGLVQSEGEDGYALWGDPETDAATWREHNPYDLVDQLKDTPLYVSCGNGESGPLDEDGTVDSIEAPLRQQNEALAKRLQKLPEATVHLYGPGTHNWVYWERELHRAWPMITKALGV